MAEPHFYILRKLNKGDGQPVPSSIGVSCFMLELNGSKFQGGGSIHLPIPVRENTPETLHWALPRGLCSNVGNRCCARAECCA